MRTASPLAAASKIFHTQGTGWATATAFCRLAIIVATAALPAIPRPPMASEGLVPAIRRQSPANELVAT